MDIKFTKTDTGAVLVEKKFFKDNRGSFFTPWTEDLNKVLKEITGRKKDIVFVQDNESVSSKGTIRGIHYQLGDFSQAKLVRVSRGAVVDFIVDLRRSSKTYRTMEWFLLSEENKAMLFVPRGFAHGFLALEDNTTFQYKVDNVYAPDKEAGINLESALPELKEIEAVAPLLDNLIMSEKDKKWPLPDEAEKLGLVYNFDFALDDL